MESVNLQMDDLFEMEAGTVNDEIEENMTAGAPMPDLETDEVPMAEAEEGQDEGDSDVLAKLRAIKGAAKKRVLKPQPKLDGSRLTGNRGLPALAKTFHDVKFKGKGHEASDLKLLMGNLEHWAHRLFPKMTFDEVIERVEKLGAKREVQTCLKRIRLDMPMIDGEYIDDVENNENIPPDNAVNEAEDFDAEAAYDEMIRQEREAMERQRREETENKDSDTEERSAGASSQPALPLQNSAPSPPQQTNIPSTPLPQTPTVNKGMTPEQKARLEANKMKALEKRAARLGVPVSALLPPPKPTDLQNEDNSSNQAALGNNADANRVKNTADSQEKDKLQNNTAGDANHQNEKVSLDFCDQLKNKGEISDKINEGNPADDMQTEDELLSALEMVKDSVGEKDSGISAQSGSDKAEIAACSEPVMDSELLVDGEKRTLVNKDDENVGDDKVHRVKSCSEPVMDSCMDVDNDSIAHKDRNTELKENEAILEKRPQLKVCDEPVLDSCINTKVVTSPPGKQKSGSSSSGEDEGRKGSAGEDLVLEFSDTTNTTQDEDEVMEQN